MEQGERGLQSSLSDVSHRQRGASNERASGEGGP